jgi:hypothetical protein
MPGKMVCAVSYTSNGVLGAEMMIIALKTVFELNKNTTHAGPIV